VSISNPQNRQDLYRALVALVIIVACAILVSGGKMDIAVFAVIIAGVSGYYFGKASDKGSIIG
jgi:uncharacterized membrane protein